MLPIEFTPVRWAVKESTEDKVNLIINEEIKEVKSFDDDFDINSSTQE